MTKILVTGGAGFIGHHFIDYILRVTDWNVVCMDRLDSSGDLNRLSEMETWTKHCNRVQFIHHDLRASINQGIADKILTNRGSVYSTPFDHVVHFAAGSHVDRSIEDPVGFLLDNVVGTAHLLDFFRQNMLRALRNDGKIVVFSTDEVFGPAPESRLFKEWDRFNPNNPYAASKAGSEALCTAYANTYGLPILVTHTTNVFGERQHSEKFIPLLVRKILRGETIQIHSDSTRTRSSSRYYLYVQNVASAVHFLLNKGSCLDGTDLIGKYNITGIEEISNLDVALSVATILGKELDYTMVDYHPSRPKHDMRYALDGSLMKNMGWTPDIYFTEGLERTVRSLLTYEQKLAS
jgi:dTDP-glucose 4,6-dehydratase